MATEHLIIAFLFVWALFWQLRAFYLLREKRWWMTECLSATEAHANALREHRECLQEVLDRLGGLEVDMGEIPLVPMKQGGYAASGDSYPNPFDDEADLRK